MYPQINQSSPPKRQAPYQNPHKQPVSVVCKYDVDGSILPLSFSLPDEDMRSDMPQTIIIESIHSIRQAASLKAGGQGIRYEVTVNCGEVSRNLYLFDDDDCWFIEKEELFG